MGIMSRIFRKKEPTNTSVAVVNQDVQSYRTRRIPFTRRQTTSNDNIINAKWRNVRDYSGVKRFVGNVRSSSGRVYQASRRGIAPRKSYVTARTAVAVAQQFGQRLPLKVGSTGNRRVGRHRGPSGRYFVPGKGAVGVYEWRRWARSQKAMQNMMQQQRMAQLMQKGYPQEQAQQIAIQSQQQQIQQNMPQMASQEALQPQQIAQPIQNYPSQGLNLMGGWDMLRIGMPSQQANIRPVNMMKGAQIFNVETPVTNRDGEYYTEPDFFTGRQVLKRRIMDRSFRN